MDQNTKHPNTADALLQKLKLNIAQNDSDKESIAAEEAAAKQANGTRYKFRVMKREEYLEKKRIADALASAADDAEISDDDLEALLRNYLKKIPKIDPVVEEVEAEAPSSDDQPVIDLDKPLSKEDTPFFEDAPIETEEAVDEITDDLDLLLSLLPEEESDAEPIDLSDEEPMDLPADELLTTSETAVNDDLTVDDDDLAALLASIPEDSDDDEPALAEADPIIDEESVSEVQGAAPSADSITDSELEAILAAMDGELPQAESDDDANSDLPLEEETDADVTMSEETDAVEEELEAMLAAIGEDVPQTAVTADAVTDDELEAMLAAIEGESAENTETESPEIADETAAEPVVDDISDESFFDALAALTEDVPAEDLNADEIPESAADTAAETDTTADSTEPADHADSSEAGEFDQTDLDLMIAFGMEDQLEDAVGHERAKKYKKAIGDRSDDHFNEMHSGDRPDTVQDKHAEYVSAAQNREIFAEYKKKYSGILFRFLGALFFLVLLFFFENDRLLGITMPAIFDREQYPLVYTLFDLQLVLLSGAMIWRSVRTGIRAIFRGRPIPESITGFLFLACIVYTAVIASLCPMHGLQLYNFPIGLAVLFELCYEFMNLRREIMSFKIVSSKKLKYAVDAIAPKDGEAERKMFAEYISDDPALFRIKRTAFVESFFARTETYPRTQRILRAVLPAVLLLVLAFFSAKFILTGDLYESLTVAYITMLLTLPSCAFIAFSYPMYRASGFAYKKDSAMIGEASLGEYADASVVSFDDKEVFPARGVRVRNVKVYGENRIDHVIYAAASVFHVVGGPLADVFETATGELGYAENVKLTRLDRDGIEARVDGGTVLIGRAAFVNRYGYAASLNESEKSMEETGDASILYIAYDNNVAAKLYIQYSVEPDFEIVLKQLYRQGVCVGIKTSDPNIDDHLLSCKIKMSKYPVKIIKCAEPKETAIIVDRLSSGIVSKSSAKALLQTLAICDRVLSASRTNNVLGVVSILLGMAAMAFCIVSGMAVTLAPVWIALYQLFWIIPVIAISRYYI